MGPPAPEGHCPCQRTPSGPSSRSPWDPLKDVAQFEQDGVLHTVRRETMAHQTTLLGSPGPRHQVSSPRVPARAPPQRQEGTVGV